MNSFLVDNITEGDVNDRLLRILNKNKKYLPMAVDGNSCAYDLKIKVGAELFDRQYTYNRDMSGRLYLGANLCKDILKIKAGDILVFVVLEENRLYQIINLSTLI